MMGLDGRRSHLRNCTRRDGERYRSGRERDGPCCLNWGGRLQVDTAKRRLQHHRSPVPARSPQTFSETGSPRSTCAIQ